MDTTDITEFVTTGLVLHWGRRARRLHVGNGIVYHPKNSNSSPTIVTVVVAGNKEKN